MAEARVAQAGESRLARVESLRALAALAVLVSHVFLFSRRGNFASLTRTYGDRLLFGGGTAVYLFFALTGFLLFWPLARHYFGGADSIDLRRYALNRALRILPLYYFALVVFMIVQADGGTFGQWWRFATFSENFFASTVGQIDGPMWSLVVELHFYVLLPLLAYGLARLASRSGARAAVILIVAAAASLYLRWRKIDDSATPPDLRLEYSLPATFVFFVPGMLLALARARIDAERIERLPRALRSADLWLVTSAALWAVTVNSFRNTGLAAAASFLTVGACVLPLRPGPVLRALDWRPLAVLGVASYSVYLLHFPVVSWLSPSVTSSLVPLLGLAGALCIAASLITYRFVERPFLTLRRRWTPVSPARTREGRVGTPVTP